MAPERSELPRDEFQEKPIPNLPGMEGWQKISVEECSEPLIELNQLNPRIEVSPQYFFRQIPGSEPTCYARAGVVEKLVEAAQVLPDNYKIVIWDAWRPTAVQQALFDEFLEQLRISEPGLDAQEYINRAQTYVSLPSIILIIHPRTLPAEQLT